MKPTVGRIVHYKLEESHYPKNPGAIRAALITHVWSDTSVNLIVFLVSSVDDDNGGSFAWTRAELGDLEGQWSWPPKV